MGVYIKGMKKPPMCEECDIRHKEENYYGDIMSATCPITGESVSEYGWGEIRERHPKCPLIEVPEPHGRLIDVDKLIEKFGDLTLMLWLDSVEEAEIISLIIHEPTVIEAEGE